MSKKQELEAQKETALAMNDELLNQFSEDAGEGFEKVGVDDVAIPYLQILQAMSPQVKRGDGRIEGAEPGLIYNTVTQELAETIQVVPCAYYKAWVEWRPRESGGGFVKAHRDDRLKAECTPDAKGRMVLPNGNHLVDTAYHYVLQITNDGALERAVVSMTSTMLKKSRQWNSLMMGIQFVHNGRRFSPPCYSHFYTLGVTTESNQHGDWFTWRIGNAQPIKDAEVYQLAKQFHQDVMKGIVEVAPPPDEHSGNDNGNGHGQSQHTDDEIPF